MSCFCWDCFKMSRIGLPCKLNNNHMQLIWSRCVRQNNDALGVKITRTSILGQYNWLCLLHGHCIFLRSRGHFVRFQVSVCIIEQFKMGWWHKQHCLVLSKHGTLNQCWFNAGPTSATLGQHWSSIGLTSPVSWGCRSHLISPSLPWIWPDPALIAMDMTWINIYSAPISRRRIHYQDDPCRRPHQPFPASRVKIISV